jgi:hypothetical protein
VRRAAPDRPDRRLPDEALEAVYRRARPAILAALLDLLSEVLATLPGIQLEQLPRMADFARILAALDLATGWTTLDAYTAAAIDVTDAVLDADPLGCAVRECMAGRQEWTGTAAQLLELVTPEPTPRSFPRSPRALSGQLRRLAPALRAGGIELDFTKTERQRLVILTTSSEGGRNPPSGPSSPSSDPT